MGRLEIFEGVDRRRGWSEEQKRAILLKVVASSLGVFTVARQYDILPQHICAWRRTFRLAATVGQVTPSFLPVTIVPAPGETPRSDRSAVYEKTDRTIRGAKVEIRCKGGRVLKFDRSLDASTLRAPIRVAEEA